jgi:hypothetical protein
MEKEKNAISKTSKIVIVGAGPAGLSTAWFLKKNGYTNVTILEKLGRVGGLCKSITIGGQSFDIGANYTTWAYQETFKIAKEVGATTYEEKPYTSIDLDADETGFKYRSFKDAILHDPDTDKKISLFTFVVAAVRYLSIRRKLSDIIDAPGYLDNIHLHPELCIPFKEWLKKNDLAALETLFSFPITIMGYGKLEEIAAPYALRYMSLRTFFPMVFGGLPFVSWFIGKWPRRFTFGFQRLWERVAWRTDVRLNVNITSIIRTPEEITVNFEYPEQNLNEIKTVKETQHYDYMFFAAPLVPDVFKKLGLIPNANELSISARVKINPYCMTTFWVDMKDMPAPIAPVLPIPVNGIPWAVARQFQDNGNKFTQFYTRPTEKQNDEDVIKQVRRLVKLMNGKIDETDSRWHTFDKFTYFQHFTAEDFLSGVYNDIANMQGKDNTFYVGGATDFELVEPIVNHSKYIVEKHFVEGIRGTKEDEKLKKQLLEQYEKAYVREKLMEL